MGTRAGGFTLVEILVALTVLALIGLIAWRGLDHVAGQQVRADAETLAAERVLRTLAQMEHDFAQRVPDALFAARQGSGATLPYALKVAADDEGRLRVNVLRRYPAPRGTASVTWGVDENRRLTRRLAGTVEDLGAEADTVEMLDEVRKIGVRFLVDGQWIEARYLQAAGTRSRALEFTIERETGERYVQVLPL